MRTKILLAAIFACLIIVPATEAKKPTVESFHSSEIQFLAAEFDGSVTVLAWGTGRNKSAAIENAYKNAVYTILFKGVEVKGQSPNLSKPLMLENNAEEKYQYFFHQFFGHKGKWKKFVSKESTRAGSNQKIKAAGGWKYGVTIRVQRSKLRQYLIEENIIKP